MHPLSYFLFQSMRYTFIPSAAISLAFLTGCSGKLVKCSGISKKDPKQWVAISEGECKKIAGTKIDPLTKTEAKKAKHFPYSSYVKCYGVAEAGMNDCGTKVSACGSSIHVARSPDAWIALPKGICQKLEGSRIEAQPKKT